MDYSAYRFNSDASYRSGGVYPAQATAEDLTRPSITVVHDDGRAFMTTLPEIFVGYRMQPVNSDKVVEAWTSNPMQFWQNQVNYAVWCATTGCGVSWGDHLEVTDPLARSLFRFHACFQVRRILAELQTPLTQDRAHDPHDNPFDRRAYERLCDEFGVSPQTDWRQKATVDNDGLGTVYSHDSYGYGDIDKVYGKHVRYDPKRWAFESEKATKPGFTHARNVQTSVDKTGLVLHIAQGSEADAAWNTFILDKSKGFTRPGVERLNDSIRTYVWALLGAQAQTRSRILGTGTAFDSQKQYDANIEDAINAPVDLPSAIKRYQDVLQYAGTKVDFVFGLGLYMAPSDMLLRIGQVAGYNNEIIVAPKEGLRLGLNVSINDTPPEAPEVPEDPKESGSSTSGVLVKPQEPSPPQKKEVRPPTPPAPSASRPVINKTAASPLEDHEDEKGAVIVGGVALGLMALWFLR